MSVVGRGRTPGGETYPFSGGTQGPRLREQLNLEVDIGAEMQYSSSHATTWHETGEEKGRENYGLKEYLRYQSNLAAM